MVFALLIGVLYATLPAAAQEPAGNSADAPTVKQIASDLYFFYDYSGSNSVFLVTDEGVLVIDTGQHPRAGQDLMDRIRKITNKPIKWVINSHFHGDHTFGRDFRRAEGNCAHHATGSAQGDGASCGLFQKP
jgi:glyoxylase-like metal-dependent hydrolase (beta-lactamase superfamily II)